MAFDHTDQEPAMAGVLDPLPWCLRDQAPAPPRSSAPPLLLVVDRAVSRSPLLLADLLLSLSPSERQRHASYRRAADQERFLLARAALRQLLSHWLGCPAAAVVLQTNLHGKPHCPGAPAFNLSHSGDVILLAFHGDGEVGVDVEQLRSNLDWRPIARRMFPPARVVTLEALTPDDQPAAFLKSWCCLEARLKARGLGLAGLGQLRQHSLVEAGAEGAVLAVGKETLWSVRAPSGYAAAVAHLRPVTGHPVGGAGADHPNPPG